MKNDYKQIFYRWLKNKGLFYSYIINVKNNWGYNDYSLAMRFNLLVENRNPQGLIDRSFCWSETREGHDFWENLDEEWDKFCNDNL